MRKMRKIRVNYSKSKILNRLSLEKSNDNYAHYVWRITNKVDAEQQGDQKQQPCYEVDLNCNRKWTDCW